MVTAILIPVIILYFYWLTRKEFRQRRAEWVATAMVDEHSRIDGVVQEITHTQEKFYVGLYLDVYTLDLMHNGKKIKAMRKIPTNEGKQDFDHLLQKEIQLYGKWEGNIFLINRITL